MTTYQINTTYYAGTSAKVKFPEGKTWDDVEYFYVWWDTLHIRWKSGEDWEYEMNSGALDCIDWKRPKSVEVYKVDDTTKETLYDVEVAST